MTTRQIRLCADLKRQAQGGFLKQCDSESGRSSDYFESVHRCQRPPLHQSPYKWRRQEAKTAHRFHSVWEVSTQEWQEQKMSPIPPMRPTWPRCLENQDAAV